MTSEAMDTVPPTRRGWLRESTSPPLVEVFRSIPLPQNAPRWLTVVASVVAAVIIVLNIKLIYDFSTGSLG